MKVKTKYLYIVFWIGFFIVLNVTASYFFINWQNKQDKEYSDRVAQLQEDEKKQMQEKNEDYNKDLLDKISQISEKVDKQKEEEKEAALELEIRECEIRCDVYQSQFLYLQGVTEENLETCYKLCRTNPNHLK